MAKPFFYRIDLIDLMDFATEPAGQSMTLLEFAKELKKGSSDHPEIQKIIDEAHNYIEKKKNAGSAGGKAKASSAIASLNNAVAKASIPLARSSNSNSNSNRSNSSTEAVPETEARTLKPLSEYSDDFLKFWSVYPVKTGKGDAWKSWKKTKPPIDKVIPAIEWQVTSKKWIEGFVPNPSTYINQRRWEDEPPQKTMTASNSAMGALARAAALRREQEECNAIQP